MTIEKTKIEVNARFGALDPEEVEDFLVMQFETILEKARDYLNIDNLVRIVITEDYFEEVKSFQRQCGYVEYATKNDYSEAFAQMISYSVKNVEKYVIFYKKEIAASFMCKLVDVQNGIENATNNKVFDQSIHLIFHELAHVNEAAILVGQEIVNKSSDEQCPFFHRFSYVIWQEYYATRISAEIYPHCFEKEEYSSLFSDIEADMLRNIQEYKVYRISFEDFQEKFGLNMRTIFIYLAYYFGVFSADNDFEVNKISYYTLRIQHLSVYRILDSMTEVLDSIYNAFNKDGSLINLEKLSSIVEEYYSYFGVEIQKVEKGWFLAVK